MFLHIGIYRGSWNSSSIVTAYIPGNRSFLRAPGGIQKGIEATRLEWNRADVQDWWEVDNAVTLRKSDLLLPSSFDTQLAYF